MLWRPPLFLSGLKYARGMEVECAPRTRRSVSKPEKVRGRVRIGTDQPGPAAKLHRNLVAGCAQISINKVLWGLIENLVG